MAKEQTQKELDALTAFHKEGGRKYIMKLADSADLPLNYREDPQKGHRGYTEPANRDIELPAKVKPLERLKSTIKDDGRKMMRKATRKLSGGKR